MSVFFYDKTFEGLLCAVFDAYSLKIFPEKLLPTGEITPMFIDKTHTVVSHSEHSTRVWNALLNKSGKYVSNMLIYV